MKTLQDKLSASVRQAKAAAPQPAATAATGKALPQAVPQAQHEAAALLPTPPATPRAAAGAEAPQGFAHPDRVWPD